MGGGEKKYLTYKGESLGVLLGEVDGDQSAFIK